MGWVTFAIAIVFVAEARAVVLLASLVVLAKRVAKSRKRIGSRTRAHLWFLVRQIVRELVGAKRLILATEDNTSAQESIPALIELGRLAVIDRQLDLAAEKLKAVDASKLAVVLSAQHTTEDNLALVDNLFAAGFAIDPMARLA